MLQDVQYADIDYMDRQLNFVLDPKFSKLPALVERIQDERGRFIIILVTSIIADREKHYQTCDWLVVMWFQDPAISGNETVPYPAFDRGVADDVFIKWPKNLSDEVVWGKVTMTALMLRSVSIIISTTL